MNCRFKDAARVYLIFALYLLGTSAVGLSFGSLSPLGRLAWVVGLAVLVALWLLWDLPPWRVNRRLRLR